MSSSFDGVRYACSTHTPGPWIIGESFTNEPAIRESNGQCVAVACLLDPDSNETEANARLISSAPDLLSALLACVDDLQLISDSSCGAYGRTIDAALAAIGKARGEKP